MLKIGSFDLNTFTELLSKIADSGRTLIHRNFIPGARQRPKFHPKFHQNKNLYST